MTDFTEKPTSYTVDTGNTYCPDHLYVIDEGSGDQLVDKGSVGGLDMTLTDSANMWTTADLTSGGATSPAIACGTGDTARSGTGLVIDSAICLVAIMASDDAANPSTRETIAAAGASASASYYTQMNSTNASNGYLQARASTAAGANVRAGTTDVWDGAFHMVAAKFYENLGGITMVVSHDGGAWSTTTSISTTTFTSDFNRLAIGKQAFLTDNTDIFTGKVVSLFVYLDDNANWTDTWIGEVYNDGDPWQFLNTGSIAPAASFYRMLRNA